VPPTKKARSEFPDTGTDAVGGRAAKAIVRRLNVHAPAPNGLTVLTLEGLDELPACGRCGRRDREQPLALCAKVGVAEMLLWYRGWQRVTGSD
jgi:hypothetical protein